MDLHLHLKLRSRCSNLSAEDLSTHLSDQFGGICITDHEKMYPKKAFSIPNVQIYYGVELSCKLGDVLAYGIKLMPPSYLIDPDRIIDTIHRQDGLAVCAHPYTNRHEGFGDYVYNFKFDAIEINGSLKEEYHKMAEKAANELNIPLIGGSDAHSVTQLNTIGTEFECDIHSMDDIVNAIRNWKCRPIAINHKVK